MLSHPISSSYLKPQANAAMGGKLYSGGYTKGNFVGVTGRGDAARAWGRHGVGMELQCEPVGVAA